MCLLFRGCSCSSVTECSTRRYDCVKKGNKCGPGCRCKNCSNTPSATGTQQQSSDALVEIEEELLHDNSLRRKYGEVCVSDETVVVRTPPSTIWKMCEAAFLN